MKKNFFIAFIPLLLLLTFILFLTLYVDSHSIRKAYKQNAEHQTNVMKQLVMDGLDHLYSDLQNLSESVDLKKYLANADDENKIMLQDRFYAFLQDRPFYDQVRFLDTNGVEKIRVNLEKNIPHIVGDDQLQDKSERYYFKETISLGKNQIYLSPLDLNVENGKLETPYKPVLRIGLPIFDQHDQIKGIILLNYLGNRLIDRLKSFDQENRKFAWLLNPDGFWMKHQDADKEWGFLFNEENTIFNLYPDAAKIIYGRENGVFEDKTGIYAFDTVHPQRILLNSQNSIRASFVWKIVEFIPAQQYKILSVVKEYNHYIIIYFATILLIILISIYVAFYKIQYNRSIAKLKVAATHDSLTNLPNRTLLNDRAQIAIANAVREENKIGVLYIDLNGFKPINDKYGHHVGDLALIEVAKRLTNCVRQSDTVARIGGDEFVVMVDPIHNLNEVKKIADKIVAELTLPYDLHKETITMGVSIGIALYPDNGTFFDRIMREADNAMYKAKANDAISIEFS